MVTGLLLSRRMINATQSYWTTLVELMTPEAIADKMTREREKKKGRGDKNIYFKSRKIEVRNRRNRDGVRRERE